MHLATRPQGCSHLDFRKERECSTSMRKRMDRSVAKGYCTYKKVDGVRTYFATQEGLRKYIDAGIGKPPAGFNERTVEPVVRAPSTIKIAGHFNRATWDKDTPPHLPYDDAGRPLFKVTIAKPFPQPTRTNTYSGAF